MKSLGLTPDEVQVQSERIERHWEVFARAVREHRVYPCFCSRKEVREALEGAASAPHGETPLYSGRCREFSPEGLPTGLTALGWRFRNELATGAQDFLVARTSARIGSDGLPDREGFVPAYQWACAIDDLDGAHALLVRAWDLESATPQQRAIQSWLQPVGEARFPAVFHCALVTRDDGRRLEKRTRGVTLPELLAAGVTADELVRRFQATFDAEAWGARAFVPGAVFGEKARTLRLADLGLREGL